jgi:hypothetical protein
MLALPCRIRNNQIQQALPSASHISITDPLLTADLMAHSGHGSHGSHGSDTSNAGGVGGMSVESDVPDRFDIQRMYWVVIGAAIAFATLINVTNKIQAVQRYF